MQTIPMTGSQITRIVKNFLRYSIYKTNKYKTNKYNKNMTKSMKKKIKEN